MLKGTVIFLAIALVSYLLGFTAIASTAMSIAGFLFFIFLALLVLSLIPGPASAKKP